jgi:hypothetical protein
MLHQLSQITLCQLHAQGGRSPQCVCDVLGLGLWQHPYEVLHQLLQIT